MFTVKSSQPFKLSFKTIPPRISFKNIYIYRKKFIYLSHSNTYKTVSKTESFGILAVSSTRRSFEMTVSVFIVFSLFRERRFQELSVSGPLLVVSDIEFFRKDSYLICKKDFEDISSNVLIVFQLKWSNSMRKRDGKCIFDASKTEKYFCFKFY